jgi:hypothetical protein
MTGEKVQIFRAISSWCAAIQIGRPGGDIQRAVEESFSGCGFGPALNPGHLITYDEWLGSPVRPGRAEHRASGMVMQCDIIPTPLPPGQAINCEDALALAGASLRAELRTAYPLALAAEQPVCRLSGWRTSGSVQSAGSWNTLSSHEGQARLPV